jgi:hypothetical protein
MVGEGNFLLKLFGKTVHMDSLPIGKGHIHPVTIRFRILSFWIALSSPPGGAHAREGVGEGRTRYQLPFGAQ